MRKFARDFDNMGKELIEDCVYLDAHAIWRGHSMPVYRRRYAGYTARLDMDWQDAAGRRRTNYFELYLASCRYGGVRAYFVCPAEVCSRHCTRLYNIDGHWLCRQCHGLAYQTQRLHKTRRLIYRRHKILNRIGGVDNVGCVKPRPKGMHERTYYRLWEEADNYQDMAFSHFVTERGLG